MKSVRCLCDCGALNCIALPKRSPRGKLPLYYCHDCGNPSYDLCVFGNRIPSEDHHRFCQVCGAGGEDIRRGAEAIDIGKNFRSFLVNSIVLSAMLYGASAILSTAKPSTPPPPWLGWATLIFFGWFFGMRLLCPFYTLLSGEKKIPLSLRALSRFAGYEFNEETIILTKMALQFRTRVRAARRRVRIFVKKYRPDPSRGT